MTTSSPCHLVTLSPCHLVTLSPCHLVTLSPCHLVTLSSSLPRRPHPRLLRIQPRELFDQLAALRVRRRRHHHLRLNVEVATLDPLAANTHARTARRAGLDCHRQLAAVE